MKGRVAVRVAQVAPLQEAVPAKLCGDTERVVPVLTEKLLALGHEVTLFASGDLRTAAALISVWPRALCLDPAVRDAIAPHMLRMEQGRRRAGEFGLLDFHMDHWPFSLFGRQRTPFLTTLHGRPGRLRLRHPPHDHGGRRRHDRRDLGCGEAGTPIRRRRPAHADRNRCACRHRMMPLEREHRHAG